MTASSTKPQIDYTVHSATRSEFPAQAQIAGRTVDVNVPGLVVELVTADGSMGHTLRFAPEADGFEALEELFAVDSEVTATFARKS